jgi:hypothetical protein
MSYNNENAPADHVCVFDLETAGLPNAVDFLDAPEADKRLTDPKKIEASLAEKRAEQLSKCALDWNVGRIVAIGAWWPQHPEPDVTICQDEAAEAEALTAFWCTYLREQRPRLVGYRCRLFDLPFLIQRSRYLDVPAPAVNMDKYRGADITDLYELLTFGDAYGTTWVMRRTLDAFCKRFGLDVPADPNSGKDIAALVEAGAWPAVANHCRCDVIKTRALAERLGLMRAVPKLAEVF